MAESKPSTSFKEAISVQPLSSHSYRARFIDQYSNGSAAHGGFVASTFQSAARCHFKTTLARQQQPDLYLLNLQYLRPVSLKEAVFHVQDVKLGALTSLIHIRLEQDGKDRAVAYITHTNFSRSPSKLSHATKVANDLVSHADSLPLMIRNSKSGPVDDPDWTLVWVSEDAYSKTFSNVQLLLPSHASRDVSITHEYVRFVGDENRFIPESLGFLADTWPQVVDAYMPGSPYSARGLVELSTDVNSRSSKGSDGPFHGIVLDQASADKWVKNWYPTLTMNLEVQNRLPDDGEEWLYQKVQASSIENGKVNIHLTMADATGKLIAVGNVSAMVVPNAYNARAAVGGKGNKAPQDEKSVSKL